MKRSFFVILILLKIPLLSQSLLSRDTDKNLKKLSIIVKFKDENKIRLKENTFNHIEDSSLSSELKLFFTAGKIERMFKSTTEEEIDLLHTRVQNQLRKKVSNLNSYFIFYARDTAEYKKLATLLSKCNTIDYFEISSQLLTPTPGNYRSSQYYLDNGAAGINAANFWSLFNNKGAGIKVVDIEQGININHHDLPSISLINTGFPNSTIDKEINHGTAVCGEIAALDNGWGTSGIAPDCNYSFAPVNLVTANLPDIIIGAMNSTSPGDFILIENEIDGFNGNNNKVGWVPVEWDRACYDAIVYTVAQGRIVIEPAGNGYQNLDDKFYSTGHNGHYPFLPANNSGAIMVGAGGSQNGPNVERSRLPFSNYGSRVDLQGVGENVMTTGGGNYYSADGVDYYYNNTFNGTSSAGPIVTGAGILIQSKYKQIHGTVLSPSALKDILKNTGKVQQNGANGTFPISEHIGPLPDVVAAYNSITCGIPQNDNCNGAILLSDNTTCTYMSGTVDCATDDGFPNSPSCNGSSSTQFGVFYKFVAAFTNATITVNPKNLSSSGLDAVVVVYSGSSCTNLNNEIGCLDPTGITNVNLTVNSLTPGQTYWIRIYDWGSSQPPIGNGGFQICVTHTPCNPPSSPAANSATTITQTEFQANWSSVIGATSYYLDVSDNSLFTSYVNGYNNLNVGNVTFYKVTGLTFNTTYYYRIRAYNSCGTSTNSSIISVQTSNSCTVPDIPSALTSNSPQCNNVTITRTANPPSGVDWYWQNTSCGTDLSLGSGTTYIVTSSGTYYLRAYNNSGKCWSTNCSNINVIVNSPPLNVTASANPNPVCINNNVNLNGNATATVTQWTWSGPNNFNSLSQSTYINNIQLNQSGNYIVTASNSCGSMSSSVSVTVNNCVITYTSHPIAAGQQHSLAICTDGTARDWGLNIWGQLGNNSNTDSYVPVPVSNLTNLISIMAGSNHSLALQSNGTVWAWGWNNMGQLGNGTTNDRNTPVQVSGLNGITAISAGIYAHSIALKSNGTVWAWGYNNNGELGNGSNNSSSTPTQASGLTDVIAIDAGGEHNLALKSNGTVWAWGNNLNGQLGNNSTTASYVPIQVPNLVGVVAIAAGSSHNLALKSDGTVWAWGANLNGQLGNGTTATSYIPVQLPNLTGVKSIAAGYFHSIAIMSDKTIRTWGNNYNGQLGNNSTSDSNVPVQVLGLSNVTFIAGGAHTIALKSDGTVWAWGSNSPGQLGDGTNIERHVPVQVINLCYVALGIESNFDNANNLSVYPNPTNDFLNIKGSHLQNGNIEIILTNTLGQQLKKEEMKISNNSLESSLSIKEFPSGIYFLIIISENNKYSIKVQKL
jgi:alpha-tubulin suppressor-like RCC1 family protein